MKGSSFGSLPQLVVTIPSGMILRFVRLLAGLVNLTLQSNLLYTMRQSPISLVTYNAQAASNRARLTDILEEFSGVDFVCLQGTKHKQPGQYHDKHVNQ